VRDEITDSANLLSLRKVTRLSSLMTWPWNGLNIPHATISASSTQGSIMQRSFDMRSPSSRFYAASLLVAGLILATLAGGVLADDTLMRKTGLWEINMKMDGVPSLGAIQQCIDQSTDNLMQQHEKNAKTDCSVMDIKRQGNKVTMHSVCKLGETVATSDAAFVGSFDVAYKGDIKTSYVPPMNGRSETKVSMAAKWLSPCKPGQKPGDVILPNMKGININEMMNDPKFQEMMKRQK
jgi:hypothetical protein